MNLLVLSELFSHPFPTQVENTVDYLSVLYSVIAWTKDYETLGNVSCGNQAEYQCVKV